MLSFLHGGLGFHHLPLVMHPEPNTLGWAPTFGNLRKGYVLFCSHSPPEHSQLFKLHLRRMLVFHALSQNMHIPAEKTLKSWKLVLGWCTTTILHCQQILH